MAFPGVEATPYHFTEKAAFASYKTAPLVSGLGYLRELAVAKKFLKAGIANTLGRVVVRGLRPPLKTINRQHFETV